MQHEIQEVQKFHQTFGLTINEKPKADLGETIHFLRYNLMKEENEEYLEAVQEGNLVGIADALGDMLYILCGTIVSHGMQEKMLSVFDEIQASNMSKLDSNGLPVYRADGKVMKGSNYFKPNLEQFFREMK
jgi:predicted HAD superfamily Cof-like phosphohydrolase